MATVIEDLEVRRRHWDKSSNRAPRDGHDMTDSLPYPFEGTEHLFAGKDVLEIGPGRGRQYDRLKGIARSYAICDISQEALDEPVFAGVPWRFLLSDYGERFGLFDVVHFWYVLHHVKPRERSDFFGFVAAHLRPGGFVLFNSPQVGNERGWYANDGMGTTWIDEGLIRRVCSRHFVTLTIVKQDRLSSGFLVVARKG